MERYSFYEVAHATACYLLAAALTATLVAVGSPVEIDPSTGEPLLWWQKSSQLFTWFLPWVLVGAVVYLAPVMHWVRSKTSFLVSLILAAVLGIAPAVLLLLVFAAIPNLRPLLALAFPLALSGLTVSVVGFGLHALLRGHLLFVLLTAGVVTLAGVLASMTS